MADIHANYLRDLGDLLKEQAIQARDTARVKHGDDFALGRAFAYYEVVSLLLSQAEAFGLPKSDIRLEGFNADQELLKPKDPK